MDKVLLVGIGGFLGSILRYGIGGLMGRLKAGWTFPLETLLINGGVWAGHVLARLVW